MNLNLLRFKAQYTCDTFSDDEKDQLEKDISAYFNNSMTIECKLKMYAVDKDVIREYAFKFLESLHPNSINANSGNVIVSVDENNVFNIVIELDEDNYSYIADTSFVAELKDYLSLITKEEYSIKLVCLKNDGDNDILRVRFDG